MDTIPTHTLFGYRGLVYGDASPRKLLTVF